MTLPTDNYQRQILAAALQDRQKADPGNPLLAHTIGLLHYWSAKALEQQGQLLMAKEVWHTVIANWASVLADDTFLQSWCRQRAATYRVEITQDDINALRNQLKDQLQEDLTNYTKQCQQAGQTLSEPLYLVLELEIASFKALKEVGGFPIASTSDKKVVCGPLMLRRLGFTAAFSDFLVGQKIAPEASADILTDIIGIVKGKQPEELDDDTQTQLMQYFSQLGIAALCLRDGYPDRALSSLEALYPYLNLSTSTSQDGRTSQIPLILDTRSPQFKERNAGYTKADHPAKLMSKHALQLAVAAHMHKAQLSISTDPINMDQASMAWQSALTLSKKIGQEEQTRAEIQEMILGRIIALDQLARWDDGITILDATIDMYGNVLLQRKLTTFLTNRGIKIGNDEQWEASVADLRRAYKLDAQNPRITRNFVVALRCLADQNLTQGRFDQSETLLLEATTVLETAIAADADEATLKESLSKVQIELEDVKRARERDQNDSNVTTPEEVYVLRLIQESRLYEAEEVVNGLLRLTPRRKQLLLIMSRIYAKRRSIEGVLDIWHRILEIDPSEEFNANIATGKVYMANRLYEQASASFLKAAAIPQTTSEQQSLAFASVAEVLIAQKRFDDADEVLTRALTLDPRNKDIQKIQRTLKEERIIEEAAQSTFDLEEDIAEWLESLMENMGEDSSKAAPSTPPSSPITPAKTPSASVEIEDAHKQEVALNTIERYLKTLQLKYRQNSENTFSLSVPGTNRKTVSIEVHMQDNVVFIGAALPDESPEEKTTLYTMLRATYLTDMFKLCRTTMGELYIAAQVPISVLNSDILGNLIRSTAQYVDQYTDNIERALSLARKIQRQTNALEASLIKRIGSGIGPRDMIPALAKRHRLEYEVMSREHLMLTIGAKSFEVNAICSDQSVSFIIAMADMHVNELRSLRHMAEVNMEMAICKVALDEDDDLCFVWALPALTEELFLQMVHMMDKYLTNVVKQLDSK